MPLRGIDLNLLVTLDALLTERHVTRAAQRLSLTQPAVSAQLTRLRELFGDPLFVPQARGVVPTQRALDLVMPLKRMLADLEILVQRGREFKASTSEQTFHLAATGALHFTLCVPLAKVFREQAPHMRLALHQLNTQTAQAKLEQGELDLVLTVPSGLSPGWKSHVLMPEHFVTVLRKDHPAVGQSMTVEQFCALDHLLVSPQAGGFQGLVDEVLKGMGLERKVVMSVQNFMVVPHILEVTDLVATLPSYLSHAFPNTLRVLPPPIPIAPYEVHAAWHPRSQSDPAHQWVRGRLAEIGAHRQPGETG